MDASAPPPAPPAAPPADPAPGAVLEEGEQAFLRGDWRLARAIARRELASPDATRREAARELRGRFTPDPQLLLAYLSALLTLAWVTWRYLGPR